MVNVESHPSVSGRPLATLTRGRTQHLPRRQWASLPEPATAQEVRAAAFDALPQAVALLGPGEQIAVANAALATLTGLSVSTLQTQPWWHVLSPLGDDPAPLLPRAGDERAYLLRTIRGQIPVTVRVAAVATPATPLLLTIEPSSPSEGAFLLDAAHELRSPLLSFNLALAELVDGSGSLSPQDEQRLVGVLQRSSVHLQTLIENLLDAASIETRARQLQVAMAETDLAEVIEEATLVVEPLLGPNGQRLVIDRATEDLVAWADPQRVRQVLVNLLHNAIKYGPRQETITVRVRQENAEIVIAVINRGATVAPEEQPHLFDRFFQGSAARRAGRGNGLGLSIARAIVEAHGGRIGVQIEPHLATMFWFTLKAL